MEDATSKARRYGQSRRSRCMIYTTTNHQLRLSRHARRHKLLQRCRMQNGRVCEYRYVCRRTTNRAQKHTHQPTQTVTNAQAYRHLQRDMTYNAIHQTSTRFLRTTRSNSTAAYRKVLSGRHAPWTYLTQSRLQQRTQCTSCTVQLHRRTTKSTPKNLRTSYRII